MKQVKMSLGSMVDMKEWKGEYGEAKKLCPIKPDSK